MSPTEQRIVVAFSFYCLLVDIRIMILEVHCFSVAQSNTFACQPCMCWQTLNIAFIFCKGKVKRWFLIVFHLSHIIPYRRICVSFWSMYVIWYHYHALIIINCFYCVLKIHCKTVLTYKESWLIFLISVAVYFKTFGVLFEGLYDCLFC